MVQEFEVVRCFSCQTFQIHQTRKDSKFSCKICGIKQSRKKVYCKGNAKDCRNAVQQLNSNIQNEEAFLNDIRHSDQDLYTDTSQEPKCEEEPCIIKPTSSKWNAFLDSSNDCPSKGLGGEHIKRFEASTSLMEDEIEPKISSAALNSFTAVKRYHNSTPKQIIPKISGASKSDFKVNELLFKSVLNEKNRHPDTSKYLQMEFEDTTTTRPFLRVNGSFKVPNHTDNQNLLLKSDQIPEKDENFKQNSLKNEAFKKFSKLDDDILDTLNKSFYS